jgi:hypothetical protein
MSGREAMWKRKMEGAVGWIHITCRVCLLPYMVRLLQSISPPRPDIHASQKSNHQIAIMTLKENSTMVSHTPKPCHPQHSTLPPSSQAHNTPTFPSPPSAPSHPLSSSQPSPEQIPHSSRTVSVRSVSRVQYTLVSGLLPAAAAHLRSAL